MSLVLWVATYETYCATSSYVRALADQFKICDEDGRISTNSFSFPYFTSDERLKRVYVCKGVPWT